jgi:hypothetical protein
VNAFVLTYHAMNIGGNAHRNNDHVALAEDLRTLHAAGISIARVRDLVDCVLGFRPPPPRRRP